MFAELKLKKKEKIYKNVPPLDLPTTMCQLSYGVQKIFFLNVPNLIVQFVGFGMKNVTCAAIVKKKKNLNGIFLHSLTKNPKCDFLHQINNGTENKFVNIWKSRGMQRYVEKISLSIFGKVEVCRRRGMQGYAVVYQEDDYKRLQ